MKHGGPLAMEGVEGVIDCEGCGLIHRHPLPSETEYRDKVRNFYSGGSIWKEPSAEDREWMKLEFEAFRKMLECWDKERRLLDVGSGKGYFGRYMSAYWGTRNFIDPAMGTGFIEDMPAKPHYSSVTLLSVLEHVLDPRAVLKKCWQRLKPGGSFLVKVPNDFSFLQKAALREGLVDRAWWVHEDHNYYFDFPGMKLLLESQGFEVLERTTSYPMEWFICDRHYNYVRFPTEGPVLHEWRRQFDRRLGSHRDAFYERIARSGMGRHVIYLARKK